MFLLPIALALLAGLLFPLMLIADLVVPGAPARLLAWAGRVPDALAGPYLATLAVPIFVLSILAVLFVAQAWLRDRRRFAEAFEACSTPARARGASASALGERAGCSPHRPPAHGGGAGAALRDPAEPRTSGSRVSAS